MTSQGANLKPRMGGHVLVDALKANGVEIAFGVPGESYLAVLDGLHDAEQIKTVICCHEGAATMMADAYGKLTGKPGIAMVTRGPGATNGSSGVHVAFQDSTPMILLIGQVGREMMDREAFQEIDYRRMFGQMAKWVAQIDDASRIPEYINRAFYTAMSGRPGPVVLALPEDMLTEHVAVADAEPAKRVEAHPGDADLARLAEMLSTAKRPMMILGGGGWDKAATEAIQAFSEANNLPVGASFRCQDFFDNRHPNYVGHVGIGIDPKLADWIRQSDLLLVLGARLGEMTSSGYSLFDIPRPKQPLVHVYPSPDELGKVYQADLPINAGPRAMAAALQAMAPVDAAAWKEAVSDLRASYISSLTPTLEPDGVDMGKVMVHLNKILPDDAVLCNGAGNFATWVHRFYQYRGFRTQLAPTSGSMGYGVPAAVAAKLTHPERDVIAFAGDGDFMMTGQEVATAAQYGANIITLVVNNGMYGTIRMHQEREYPGRVSGTEISGKTDYAKVAEAYGGYGERVTKSEDFAAAFERARTSGKPAILDLRVDPNVSTPKLMLSEIRETAIANSK